MYGRKKRYAFKYQGWARFPDGKLLGIFGPFVATAPDIKIFDATIPPYLISGEKVLADKGYQGSPHALSPFKRRARPRRVSGQPTPEQPPYRLLERKFNALLRARRVHIERVFRRMKQFTCLTQTWRHPLEKHPKVIAAVGKLVNEDLEVRPLFKDTPNYIYLQATILTNTP